MRSYLLVTLSMFLLTRYGEAQQTISTERFGAIETYQNSESTRFSVILFSPFEGINDDARSIAKKIADSGGLVSIIDSKRYAAALQDDEGECSYLGGEMTRLNQSILSTLKSARYDPPIIAGIGSGASLAYSIFQQKPDEFPGLLTIDFCPVLTLGRPLCPSDFVAFGSLRKGSRQIISKHSEAAPHWHALSRKREGGGMCDTFAENDSIKHLTNLVGKLDGSEPGSFRRGLEDAVRALALQREEMEPSGELDLPLNELLPEAKGGSTQAIFFSGDGGWAWIDKGIAAEIVKRGFPVIGLDSLRFYWRERTPEETAKAIDQIYRRYRAKTGAGNLFLIGFSFGAEVLPFAIPHLSEGTKRALRGVVLLNPGTSNDFEIHIADWISSDDDDGKYKVKDAFGGLQGYPVYCIYGADDDDNACIGAEKKNLTVLSFPGDHHFDGEYEALGAKIVSLFPTGKTP